jgi:hypothetical protein
VSKAVASTSPDAGARVRALAARTDAGASTPALAEDHGPDARNLDDPIHPHFPHIPDPPVHRPIDSQVGNDAHRSALAAGAVAASNWGGVGKTIFDAGRVGLKLPEAKRAGMLPTAIRQMVTAAPTTTILNPELPAIATAESGMQSFTKLDGALYRTSALAGVAISGVQLLSAAPNIIDGVKSDGLAGLVDSKAGRSGIAQLAGGGLAVGLLGKAGMAAWAGGTRGALSLTMEAAAAPLLTRPWVAGVGFATSAVVLANEWGYFDWMDKGDPRSTGAVLQDAAHNTPVLGWFVDKSDEGKALDAAKDKTAQQATDAQYESGFQRMQAEAAYAKSHGG